MPTHTEPVVRPFRPEEDLAALVALHNTVELAEGREASVAVEQMEKAVTRPNVYRWVVPAPEENGKLAGYGVLFYQTAERCYGDAKVHPAWRRRGLGRLLIDELVAKATQLGTRYLAIDVAAANQDALRFLLSQGFRFRGDTWALLASPEVALPPPDWPDGYSVRPYAEVGDLSVLTALCNRTFGDLWGHWENTPGMVDEARMADILDNFDPNGIFIVFDRAGHAVAQCRSLASAGGDTPHVLDQPGVVPEQRAAGLHAPLALTAAHWLRSQGRQPVRLESWGDAAETVAIYQALGFVLSEHEVSYVRELK